MWLRKTLGTDYYFKCSVCKEFNFLLVDMLYSDANKLCADGKWDSVLPSYFTDEQVREMIAFRNTLPEEAFKYAPYLTREAQTNPAQNQHEPAYTPTCPTCHSPDIVKIGSAERAGSVLLFGVFSSKINKQFEFKNCGYKW